MYASIERVRNVVGLKTWPQLPVGTVFIWADDRWDENAPVYVRAENMSYVDVCSGEVWADNRGARVIPVQKAVLTIEV